MYFKADTSTDPLLLGITLSCENKIPTIKITTRIAGQAIPLGQKILGFTYLEKMAATPRNNFTVEFQAGKIILKGSLSDALYILYQRNIISDQLFTEITKSPWVSALLKEVVRKTPQEKDILSFVESKVPMSKL
jgi:hypothetical protein